LAHWKDGVWAEPANSTFKSSIAKRLPNEPAERSKPVKSMTPTTFVK
jgi:hypothetical protein